VLFAVQGAGVGVAMPAATASVMDVLPRERAGAGSALTNTARQVAVALGVAVLGSILAESYRSTLSPQLAQLPTAVRGTAAQSVSATQAVAQQLGPSGRFLLAPGNTAFVNAIHITTVVAALIAVAGAAVVLRWMPGRQRQAVAAEDVAVAQEVAEADRELAGELAAEPARVQR